MNNTFVYRKVKTTKNDRYLVLEADGEGSVHPIPRVIEGWRTNTDFTHVRSGAKNYPTLIPLDNAVEDERERLGKLVFVLIGQVDDTIQVSAALNAEGWDDLILDPTLSGAVRLEDDSIRIRETFDEDGLWEEVLERAHEMGKEVGDGFREAVGAALDAVEDEAYASVRLPAMEKPNTESILGSIVQVLSEQLESYDDALEKCGGDPARDRRAFNEILRLAYNFASDATTFIELIVSICDLKPVVLWGTIGKHYALSEAFRALPWIRSRNKPSLKNYIDTIGDARNSAFHDLFPFTKTLEVQLPADSLQDVTIRMFAEFRKRRENELKFQDKELVDVLTSFTRAGERRVAPRFWRQNSKVMRETIDLFRETEEVLSLLWQNQLN